MKPTIGNWYRIQGSDSFEVVAFDEDDGTIELQYFDGTVEEMDLEDWQAEHETGALDEIEPPEDWTGSVDVDPEEDDARGTLRIRQGRRPPAERRQTRGPRSLRVSLTNHYNGELASRSTSTPSASITYPLSTSTGTGVSD